MDALTWTSKELYNEIEQYLKQIDPELDRAGAPLQRGQPLFDKFDIETEIRDLFKRRCDLPTGGYLIIQPTEALVSIDVNTGRYTGKKDPEKTILQTNLEAAREIARQLRLRDVGGIIVCDFIDMETRANRDKVLQELRTHLGRDRARTKAFAVSELGLIEMTRQRVRPSLWASHDHRMPHLRRHRTGVHARNRHPAAGAVPPPGRPRGTGSASWPSGSIPRWRIYLLEEEPKLLQALIRATGLELELRDDPMMRLDEFRLMSRPGGPGRDGAVRGGVASAAALP